jgi:flagellar basal-body rod modification protein FlgD
MSVDSISGTGSSNVNAIDAAGLSSQVMSQDDFLKLLVAQMTSQNPTDPMSNQDLMGQMVQFSTLQNNTALQSTLAQLKSSQDLVQANSLLGRQVLLQDASGNFIQGIVSDVDISTGAPMLLVNGAAYNLNQVLSVSNPPTAT